MQHQPAHVFHRLTLDISAGFWYNISMCFYAHSLHNRRAKAAYYLQYFCRKAVPMMEHSEFRPPEDIPAEQTEAQQQLDETAVIE